MSARHVPKRGQACLVEGLDLEALDVVLVHRARRREHLDLGDAVEEELALQGAPRRAIGREQPG